MKYLMLHYHCPRTHRPRNVSHNRQATSADEFRMDKKIIYLVK